MNTAELRNTVINKIQNLNNDELLRDLIRLIDDAENDSYYLGLTQVHITAIQTAIHQIENGSFLTNEQANREIGEWLNR